MPRFYINVYQAGDVLTDPEGVELAGPAAVRTHALLVARDLLAADAVSGVVDLDTTLRVVDEQDAVVLSLSFADAVAFVSGGTV